MFAVNGPVHTRVILIARAVDGIHQLCQFDIRYAIETAPNKSATLFRGKQPKIRITRPRSRREWRTEIEPSGHDLTSRIAQRIRRGTVNVGARRRQYCGNPRSRSRSREDRSGNAVGISGGYRLDKLRRLDV